MGITNVTAKPAYCPLSSAHDNNPIVTLDSAGEAKSRFWGDVWDFSDYIPHKNVQQSRKVIQFDLLLANGTSLLDKANANLLFSVKEYLYTRLNVIHPKSGKVLGPQSLIGNFYCLATFVNFLLSQNMQSFAAFKTTDVVTLRHFLYTRNPQLSEKTYAKYLGVIEDLYHFSGVLKDGLSEHPWPDSSVYYLSNTPRQNATLYNKQTPRVPDYLIAALFTQCVDYLKHHSERLVNAALKLESRATALFDTQLKKNKISNDISTARKDKHADLNVKKSRGYLAYQKETLTAYGFANKRALNKAIQTARGCCYAIIATTTGMRNSEIASLTCDSFFISQGWDGEEYAWLRGLTYKLESAPRQTKWMIPILSQIALTHLLAMNEVYQLRIAQSLPYLSSTEREIQRQLSHFLFIANDTKTNSYNGICNARWNASLRQLATDFNLRVKDPDNDLNLPIGIVWPLSTHHFRRTFACLAARSSLGDLRYLREHFKHWSLDMTLHYANQTTCNNSLFDEVLTERNALQHIIISDWLTTQTPLAGGRGAAITQFKRRGKVKISQDMPTLLNQISDSVFVRGTGHSWCLASGAGCGGDGLYDAIQCVSCDSAVIDKSHLPLWRGIKAQHIEILTLDEAGGAIKARAHEYIAQAEAIIKKLS